MVKLLCSYKEIKSHPDTLLTKHINNIMGVSASIVDAECCHNFPHFPDVKNVMEIIAKFHDLGKVTHHFQKFIADPDNYKGNKKLKAHVPLSFLISTLWLSKCNFNKLEAFAVIQAVISHHSHLFTLDALERKATEDKFVHLIKRQRNDFDKKLVLDLFGTDLDKLGFYKEPWFSVEDYIDEMAESINKLPLEKAISFRLWVQYLFSLLLEGDRALLAIDSKDIDTYFDRKLVKLKQEAINVYISKAPASPLNSLRMKAKTEVIQNDIQSDIYSLTLPTGMGKTLTAASWALKIRNKKDKSLPKIIVVLPFLSIIDQTQRIYKELFDKKGIDFPIVLPSHSLSEILFDTELEKGTAEFFSDTWHSDIIITTYDQFIYALADVSTKYQLRFHNLCNAIIIIDEVQSVPCRLWDSLDNILSALSQNTGTRILVMSATQPGFIENAKELIHEPKEYFKKFSRYRIVFSLNPINIDDFISKITNSINDWRENNKYKILITMNTRASAKRVFSEIIKHCEGEVYFLTADITPKDRLNSIDRIKEAEKCVVVSTQVVEAGVDIDMDFVIRDFAPLDSIIQIAGRCNRNYQKTRSEVEIYYVIDEKSKPYSEMIYDEVKLQETRKILSNISIVKEEDVYELSKEYFGQLKMKKDIGKEITKAFSKWSEMPDIHQELRGEYKEQYNFIVIKQDRELKKLVEEALNIDNKWERKRTLRSLNRKIALVTVSTFAKRGFVPELIAEKFHNYWLLNDNCYDEKSGLILPENIAEMETCII